MSDFVHIYIYIIPTHEHMQYLSWIHCAIYRVEVVKYLNNLYIMCGV